MSQSKHSHPNPSSNSQHYAIVAVFPGRKPQAVGRAHNRSDADAMARFLEQQIPKGRFYVVFDVEETSGKSNEF